MIFSSLLLIALCYLGWANVQPKRQAIRIRPTNHRRHGR